MSFMEKKFRFQLRFHRSRIKKKTSLFSSLFACCDHVSECLVEKFKPLWPVKCLVQESNLSCNRSSFSLSPTAETVMTHSTLIVANFKLTTIYLIPLMYFPLIYPILLLSIHFSILFCNVYNIHHIVSSSL